MVDTSPETGGNDTVDDQYSEDESGDRSVKSYHHGVRPLSSATNSGHCLVGEDRNEVGGELGLGLDENTSPPQQQGINVTQNAPANNKGQAHHTVNQIGFNAGTPAPVSPYLPNIWKANFGVPSQFSRDIQRATDMFMSVSVCAPTIRQKISDLAQSAALELLRKATSGSPLWELDREKKNEVLNKFEYMKEFGTVDLTLDDIMKMVEVRSSQGLPSFAGLHDDHEENSGEFGFNNALPNNNELNRGGGGSFETEASRAYIFTRMNPLNIVEMLMDLDQWSSVFSSMVGRGLLLGIGSNREGNYREALQVVSAEFHFLSPLVQSRDCIFARYCKQLDQCTWLVVDVSLESIFPDQLNIYRRKPSGCLIQMFPNGFTRVIWVEHAEVGRGLVHYAFSPLLTSGFAFSAKRWIFTMLRQFKRLVTIMGVHMNPPYDEENCKLWREVPEMGRATLLKLSERMMRSFCLELGGSDAKNCKIWRTIHVEGHEDVRVATRHCIDDRSPGNPQKTTILLTTSIWLAVPPKRVFTFLCDPNSRSEWDLLSSHLNVREVGYILQGEDPGNRVSIIQAKNARSNDISVLYLQESYSHITGSYVVYAPIECAAMSAILRGRAEADGIAILPSGFVIMPDRPTVDEDEVIGSVLTIGFHIVDGQSSSGIIPPASLAIIQRMLTDTVSFIKSAVVTDDYSSNSQAVRRNAMKRRRKHLYK